MSVPREPDERQRQLDDTRDRLSHLEAEAHRLRAQLARLEATKEDEAAARIEARLAKLSEEEVAQRQAAFELDGSTVVQPLPSDPDPIASSLSDSETVIQSLAPADVEPIRLEKVAPETPLLKRRDAIASTAPAMAEEIPAIEVESQEERDAKRPLAWLRDAPAWALSLGTHVVAILLLGLLTFATTIERPEYLLANAADGDEFLDEFSEVDLTPVELDTTELEVSELELEPTEVTEVSLSELDAPWEAADMGLSDLAPGLAALPTDAAVLMAGDAGGQPNASGGRGQEADGGGKPGSARFFGARSAGDRFAFLVDNSGSMKDGRMETTLMELQNAIGAMSAKQSFYIIFFSDQAYPMFFPNSVEQMTPATRENKKLLAEWLPTVEMCVGGRLDEAIEMVEKLDPHVVYLLSDGDIGSTRTMQQLTQPSDRKFTIHTLGMTVRNAEHASKLLAIAQANRGGFKPVGINQVAARMAQQRPIPYHNKGPGPVWGGKVRPR